MTRRSKSLRLFDYSGGMNSNSPETSLELNQALALDNIVLLGQPGHSGFQKRRGNTVFNSSAMESGAAVQGISYYRQADLDEWLVTVCNDQIYKSEFDGTMDDITGALTITGAANNIWTFTSFNNVLIGFGGAPDAPWVWNGTGNAAALGGTPPSANFGLSANNRVFAGNTAANPSTIYWSILGDHADWTGSGSGSQNVALNDGDSLTGGAQVGPDHLILFKQHSIHDLVIRTAPFPLFTLKREHNVGAISKNAIVTANNLIYYITPEPRMKATDGTRIIDFPDTIDDIWDGLNKSRLKYAQGIYYPRLNQIWWSVSNGSSSTNNLCIVWDLARECWLRYTTGYKMNGFCMAQDRTAYGCAYDGKIYKMDVASTFEDASETSPGTINSYWRSGWYDMNTMVNAKIIPFMKFSAIAETSGTIDIGYGYDFASDRRIETFSIQQAGDKWGNFLWGVGKWGGATNLTKLMWMKGYGDYFQFMIRNQNIGEQITFNGLEFPVKIIEAEQGVQGATA